MNWSKIGLVIFALLFMALIYWQREGIRAMLARSRAAPQYWGTYAALMAAVIAFVILLIKL